MYYIFLNQIVSIILIRLVMVFLFVFVGRNFHVSLHSSSIQFNSIDSNEYVFN